MDDREQSREPAKDPAKARFFIIQAMRWVGLALAAIGLLVVYHKLPLPAWAGYLLVPISFFVALVIPGVLARRWRSPRA